MTQTDYLIITSHPSPLPGKEFDVKAKVVINATGPFTDSLRKMDNQETQNICQPSAGVHIVIPGYYRCSHTHACTLTLNWLSCLYKRCLTSLQVFCVSECINSVVSF